MPKINWTAVLSTLIALVIFAVVYHLAFKSTLMEDGTISPVFSLGGKSDTSTPEA